MLALHAQRTVSPRAGRDQLAVGAAARESALEREALLFAIGGEARHEHRFSAIARIPGVPEQRPRAARHDDGHRPVDQQAAELSWQDADDREWMPLQFDPLSNRVTDRSEVADRICEAEHGDLASAAVVLGRQQPAGRSADPQHGKQAAVDGAE